MATEIGDKTFFIAAVLSMWNDHAAVFGGAILALIVMTVLSTLAVAGYFLSLLYVLGAATADDAIGWFNDDVFAGISMTSVVMG
mgnify:CR=1 FL=1